MKRFLQSAISWLKSQQSRPARRARLQLECLEGRDAPSGDLLAMANFPPAPMAETIAHSSPDSEVDGTFEPAPQERRRFGTPIAIIAVLVG